MVSTDAISECFIKSMSGLRILRVECPLPAELVDFVPISGDESNKKKNKKKQACGDSKASRKRSLPCSAYQAPEGKRFARFFYVKPH